MSAEHHSTIPIPAAGAKLETALEVPAGPDSAALPLTLLVARGRRDGPTVAVLGGVHGDEYEGIAASGRLWRDVDPTQLAGMLVVVPVASPHAHAAGARVSPVDGLDLARTFPGSAVGSVTERIAHVLAERVITNADFLVDLHSAGQHYAMPLLCGAYSGDDALGTRSMAAAAAFGAPLLWSHPVLHPGRSLSTAIERGIPCRYAECGGGGRVRPAHLAAYLDGVQRVLAHLGALPPLDAAPPPRLRLRDNGNTDAALKVSHDGILLERVQLLDRVRAGQPLADVVDVCGAVLETLFAPHDGIIVLARRTARVRAGDGAYLLGTLDR